MKKIALKIENNSITIESPYDAQLVDNIKDLPTGQRKYVDGKWVCNLIDPHQKEDEENNLEYLRRICQQSANLNSWQFHDYSSKTNDEIIEDKQQAAHTASERHVANFLAVMDELPSESLKLIRWDKIIELQLDTYLGEDEAGYELFMRLKKASLDTFKPTILGSFDSKMTAGFVFKVANDERIIRRLLPNNTRYLVDRSSLRITQKFEDSVVHLADENNACWVGVLINNTDMRDRNFSAQSWEICATPDLIYCVCKTEKLVAAWLHQSSRNIVGFGGSFAHITQAAAELPAIVENLHLIEWFESWATDLLNREISPGHKYRGFKPCEYAHPADELIDYYHRFKDRSGLSVDKMSIAIANIEAKKQAAANATLEKARKTAIADAIALLDRYTKTELVDLSSKYGIVIKKSATKSVLVQSISALISQSVAEDILKLVNS
ncbi:MAG: hypothetical protein HC778_01225 [Chamaesiphon sp. CSU_1_12]|nr:hypothetical protein [Chamaesiphon sp. CSU_1_12]